MATVRIPEISGQETPEQLANIVAKTFKELRWLLNNLDFRNISELRVQLPDGAFIKLSRKGLTINDGTKDTFTVDLDGLTTMTGAIVQSATGYPKVEMDPNGNLFKASSSLNDYIQMLASFSGGSPALVLNDGSTGTLGYIRVLSTGLLFIATSLGQGSINISSGEDLVLSAQGDISVNSWSKFYNRADQVDLQEELDNLQSQINNLNARVTALENSGGGA